MTAAVVPIRTEPAPARLRFGRGEAGSIGARLAELVTAKSASFRGNTADFVRSLGAAPRPRSRLRHEWSGDVAAAARAGRAVRARRARPAGVPARAARRAHRLRGARRVARRPALPGRPPLRALLR